MPRRLYAHPFSSYCWKVLVALYENDLAFDYRSLEDPAANAELAAYWPLKRFPYALFYIEHPEHVHVIRCVHMSRDIPPTLQEEAK